MSNGKGITPNSSKQSLSQIGENNTLRGCELVFKDINVKAEKKVILNGVNGLARPGEIMAIMGPSGAGKTTLLNCLAGRTSIDHGQMLMNSRPINKQLRRKISYVLQKDIFLSNLTCWQTIWYTALLRLPGSMPLEDKRKRVYEIVDGLNMRKCLETIIGDNSHRGLSGGEKKRTSIACELLTNPQLMLLDEPTSGLDSSTAYSLCCTLKNYAKISGKTVIVSIHQPSSQIFNMFDRLLLLCDGQTAFYGSVAQCAQHFTNLGQPCPPNYNLADHILDLMKGSKETKDAILEQAQQFRFANLKTWKWVDIEKKMNTGNKDWYPKQLSISQSDIQIIEETSLTSGSEAAGIINKGFDSDDSNGEQSFSDPDESISSERDVEQDGVKYQREYNSKWPTGFSLQYSVLARRYFGQTWPILLSKWNLIQVVLVGFFSAVFWFQIEPVEETIPDRIGLIYFLLIHMGFTACLNAALTFPGERVTLNKERLGGYYRLSAYYLAKVSVDIPLFLVAPTLYTTLVFWTSGISYNFWVFVQFLLTSCLSSLTAYSMGCLYGALVLDINLMMTCATVTMVVMMISSGFFVTNFPIWALWVKYGAYMTYSAGALFMMDIFNTEIKCSPVESLYLSCLNTPTLHNQSFTLPSISKTELAKNHTVASAGLEIWHCLVILSGICVVMHVLAYISLRFIRKPHLA